MMFINSPAELGRVNLNLIHGLNKNWFSLAKHHKAILKSFKTKTKQYNFIKTCRISISLHDMKFKVEIWKETFLHDLALPFLMTKEKIS